MIPVTQELLDFCVEWKEVALTTHEFEVASKFRQLELLAARALYPDLTDPRFYRDQAA